MKRQGSGEKLKIEYVSPEKIKPYNKNARRHKKKDIENIAKSIEKYGMNDAIGVWGEQNVIVEGHGRFLACKKLGIDEIPIVRLDHLTDEERRAYAIAHNATAELSEWDVEILQDEIQSGLDLGDFDFSFDFETEDDFEKKMKNQENMESSDEYEAFEEKFKPKKTTDDCYTPKNIYEAVKEWVLKRYDLKNCKIVRPFYPGGDYQKETYDENCVVVDNPPFSISTEIVRWYNERNIRYFMFAPQLTLFTINGGKEKYIICNSGITYENGAVVSTSFVTNMGDSKVETNFELYKAIKDKNDENLKEKAREIPSYEYPDNVLTSAMLGKIVRYGVNITFEQKDVCFVRELEVMKDKGKAIFGGGFLLSEKAAAEKAAAEKAAAEKAAAEKWVLSEKEIEIVKGLGSDE